MVSDPSSWAIVTAGHLDEVAEPGLQGALHEHLQRRGELVAVGGEGELQQAAAEGGAHDALPRRREQHLLDQVTQVLIGRASPRSGRARRSAAARRSARAAPGYVTTRPPASWVDATIAGPLGAPLAAMQSPTLSGRDGGLAVHDGLGGGRRPLHLHAGLRSSGGTVKTQPATMNWSVTSATGIPLTSTRALALMVVTWPPCGHIATAPTWNKESGHVRASRGRRTWDGRRSLM